MVLADFSIFGILQDSSAVFPQTEHSPIFSFNMGLLVAQVPLNSFPVRIWRILIRIKERPKAVNIIDKIYKNSMTVYLVERI